MNQIPDSVRDASQHVLSQSYGKDSIACLAAIEKLGTDTKNIKLKYIEGFAGRYMICSNGMVYSVISNKILAPDVVRGYRQVTLYMNGEAFRHKVHRQVALAFVPNPNNEKYVNHKDENKSNNDVSNLEWCSIAYNNSFGTRLDRVKQSAMKSAPYRRDAKKVKCIETGAIYHSTVDAERKTGVYHSHISRCCNGTQRSAGAMHWEYVMTCFESSNHKEKK